MHVAGGIGRLGPRPDRETTAGTEAGRFSRAALSSKLRYAYGVPIRAGGTVFTIEELRAREILDSRGNPTVEVECLLAGGAVWPGRRAVRGVDGSREALELRDGDERYGGKGVQRAVHNVEEEIAPEVCGMDARDQALVDATMLALDGTATKSAWEPTPSWAFRWRSPRRPRRPPSCRSTPIWAAGCDGAAGADAERPQRRRPRRQLGRHPGVHDRTGRLRASPRRCAPASRSTTSCKGV